LLVTIIYGAIDRRFNILKYIGKTSVGLEKRAYQHLTNKDHPSDFTLWLQEVERGVVDFFVIEELESDDDWRIAERFWIAYFRFLGCCDLLNKTRGGNGFVRHTEKSRANLSLALRNRPPPSEDTKHKISESVRTQWADPNSNLRRLVEGARRPTEATAATAASFRRLWTDPEYRKRRIENLNSPESLERRSRAGRARWARPGAAECMRTPAARVNVSRATKLSWINNRESMVEAARKRAAKRKRLPNGTFAPKSD
jgi:hypothetical protein